MPEPIITQTFAGFRGDSEDVSVGLLPEIFSSSESENVEIDKLGEIVKILGYAKANSSAITTNTGGDAVKVVALAFYRSLSGGTVTRRLVAAVDDGTDELEFWHSTDAGATWSFLKDIGSSGVGQIPRFRQWGNTLYVAVGSGVPQTYDGSSMANAGGTQSPTPTISAGGEGPCSGNYQCVLVSMIGKTRQVASAVSSTLAVDGTDISVSWTADSDSNVTGYEVYFTTGTGVPLYKAGYVDGRLTVAFTHSIPDTNLLQEAVLDAFGDAPASGSRFLGIHKQRMFWDRGASAPDEWEFSTPGDPDGIGDNNFIVLRDPEFGRDQNTGFTGNYEDQAIFWQEFSVWKLYGSSEIVNNVPEQTLEKTTAVVGAVSDLAVVKVPVGARYVDGEGNVSTTSGPTLAFFSSFLDVRLFDGNGDTLISEAKVDFLAGVQYQYRHLIWAEHDVAGKTITWHVPHGGSQTVCNKAIQWDYDKGSWTEKSQTPFASGARQETASVAQQLMAGEARVATGGYVYTNKSGNSYDGDDNDITAKFWTIPLAGIDAEGNPAGDKYKRLRRIHVVMKAQSSTQELTVRTYGDYATSGATPHGTYTLEMQAANATHKHGRAILRDATSKEFLEARAPRIEIMDSSDDPAWGIEKVILEYQVLSGMRRS